ncbi:MAG: hypothetical protein Q9228_004439 [Teloschistes exilis]
MPNDEVEFPYLSPTPESPRLISFTGRTRPPRSHASEITHPTRPETATLSGQKPRDRARCGDWDGHLGHRIWVPPNVKFEVDDCEEPWTFTEKFDVVHARYLAAAIEDWPRLVSQAFQFTKPGGYAEFQDYDLEYYSEDGTLNDDCKFTPKPLFPFSFPPQTSLSLNALIFNFVWGGLADV